jgi:excisionase family DNA binding protein
MALHDRALEDGKPYYSSGEVAKLFGVTQRTVANWCDQGRLPCIVTPSGHRRIPASALAGGREADAKLAAFQAQIDALLGGRVEGIGDEIAAQVRARRRKA